MKRTRAYKQSALHSVWVYIFLISLFITAILSIQLQPAYAALLSVSGNTGASASTSSATVPSSTVIPVSTASSTSVVPSSVSTLTLQGTILAKDTFVRANQKYWGSASDNHFWGGDVANQSAASITGDTGVIESTKTEIGYLGISEVNVDTLLVGELDTYQGGALGLCVLGHYSSNQYTYEACLTGTTFYIQRVSFANSAILASQPVASTPGKFYAIEFEINGTTLEARYWDVTSALPATWQLSYADASMSSGNLSSGLGGVAYLDTSTIAATATIPLFIEASVS